MTGSTSQKVRNTNRPTPVVKDFVQQGADYSKNLAQKSEAATEAVGKSFRQSYSTAGSGATEFTTQWIEMVRENTNASLDFARQLLAVKSPSEFFELSAAHTRQQFESFAQQAQQLARLTQKATTDAMKPIQAGMNRAFDKAA